MYFHEERCSTLASDVSTKWRPSVEHQRFNGWAPRSSWITIENAAPSDASSGARQALRDAWHDVREVPVAGGIQSDQSAPDVHECTVYTDVAGTKYPFLDAVETLDGTGLSVSGKLTQLVTVVHDIKIVYDYDADGRLVAMQDGLGQVTRYEYDNLGRRSRRRLRMARGSSCGTTRRINLCAPEAGEYRVGITLNTWPFAWDGPVFSLASCRGSVGQGAVEAGLHGANRSSNQNKGTTSILHEQNQP